VHRKEKDGDEKIIWKYNYSGNGVIGTIMSKVNR
jgi:hypothetical protein